MSEGTKGFFAAIGIFAVIVLAVVLVWGFVLNDTFTLDIFRVHADCIRPPLSSGGGLCLIEAR